MATHSSTFAQKIPWTKEPGAHGVTKSWTRLSDFTFFLSFLSDKTIFRASWVALVVKKSPANAGDTRDAVSIPGSARAPGEGHDNPLQYSCLENPMDRGTWRGYRPWGRKKLDTTEVTQHIHTHTIPIVPLQENCQVSTAEYLYSDGILNWETPCPSPFPPPCISMNEQS